MKSDCAAINLFSRSGCVNCETVIKLLNVNSGGFGCRKTTLLRRELGRRGAKVQWSKGCEW
jgi:hypothetical protein